MARNEFLDDISSERDPFKKACEVGNHLTLALLQAYKDDMPRLKRKRPILLLAFIELMEESMMGSDQQELLDNLKKFHTILESEAKLDG